MFAECTIQKYPLTSYKGFPMVIHVSTGEKIYKQAHNLPQSNE